MNNLIPLPKPQQIILYSSCFSIAKLPISLPKSLEILYSYDNYYNEIKSRMQHAYETARKNLLNKK